jgi:hypothetical protein
VAKSEIQLSGGAAPTATDVAAQGMAEAEATVKAQLVHAIGYPRDENRAYLALTNACQRETFAVAARYSYPRGGQEIDGLSVGFAREAARVWGNLRFGYHIVSERNAKQHPPHGQVVLRGYAWDIQTNVFVEKDATFPYLIFRKRGGWQEPDERDKRELIARHAAIAYRNCILDLIPPDVKEELLDKLRKTSATKAKEDLTKDRAGTIKRLLKAFGAMGVTKAMLESYLELDDLDELEPSQLAQLRGLYSSIKDGATVVGDAFPDLAGGQAAARGQQSAAAAEAEAELDSAATHMGAEWEEVEEEPDDEPEEPDDWTEEPEEEEEPAPKKRAAPKKRGSKPAAEEVEEDTPEIRIHNGAWVGDLPKVGDLPYVLDHVPEEVCLDLYERDNRQSAVAHYYKKLEEYGYELE